MIVQGTNLSMIRGDSESITVSLTDEQGSSTPLIDGDTIYFTVKTTVHTTSKILQKVVTLFEDGVAYIEITPEDTKSLIFRDYVYDVQLTRADGTIMTIIPPSKFTIKGEVTYE